MMKSFYIFCSLLLIALFGCASRAKREKKENSVVMVTIEPQRFFTEAIGGNNFMVKSMVPKGSSPETYDPTPRQLVGLTNSKAYLRIGHIAFEQSWMDRLTDNAPHMRVFDTSKGVEVIHTEEHDHGDHQHVGGVEPHIWSSVVNARIIAQNTFKALCALDKEHEAEYLERYASLRHRIDSTDNIIRDLFSHSQVDHAFMIYHPALSYFARDYGLLQISIEEGGKEPSPAHLKELIDISKKEKIRVIFIQPEFDHRNAEIVAKQTGAKIVPINPLAYDWEKEMIHIAKSLCQ